MLIILIIFGLHCRKGPFGPIGAMCYSIAVTPERTDFVCPVCGEKTLYAFDDTLKDPNDLELSWETATLANELDLCRRLTQQINRLDVKLDESQFCRKCNPGIEHPQIGITVINPNTQQSHQVWGIREYDLTLIKGYTDGTFQTQDMSDVSLLRLEELLGVKLNDTE